MTVRRSSVRIPLLAVLLGLLAVLVLAPVLAGHAAAESAVRANAEVTVGLGAETVEPGCPVCRPEQAASPDGAPARDVPAPGGWSCPGGPSGGYGLDESVPRPADTARAELVALPAGFVVPDRAVITGPVRPTGPVPPSAVRSPVAVLCVDRT